MQRYKCECKPGQERNSRRRRRRRFYEEYEAFEDQVVHSERYRRSQDEEGFIPGPNTNPALDRCGNTNECLTGNHYCSENAVCQDTVGSYLCHCQAGYQGDTIPGTGCWNINECEVVDKNGNYELVHCDPTRHDCIDTVGSFECLCKVSPIFAF